MSLLHRGLKLCPYGKPLLQGRSIDPESKGPDKHSQLKIFFLSQYIYKIGTELRKLFNQDSPYQLLQNKPLFSVWHTLYGSLRRRRSLTSVSNVCEPLPISLFWAPNGFNELPGVRFEFPFNLIDKLTVVFFNRPIIAHTQILSGTQVGPRTRISALFRRRTLPEFSFVCGAGQRMEEKQKNSNSCLNQFPRSFKLSNGKRPGINCPTTDCAKCLFNKSKITPLMSHNTIHAIF